MIRESSYELGYSYAWTYDDAGNILSRKEYNEYGELVKTVNYSYEDSSWGDLLTGYDGRTITSMGGNILSDGIWAYTWAHGKELAAMSNGTTTWSYEYDANGMRTHRTNGSTTYRYVYNGSSLSQMTVGSNTLHFTYDASGKPMAVTYNGTTYYYATNMMGDVLAILDGNSTAVVSYCYNAWGNEISCTGTMAATLGVLNPLRYRSYVYDHETGLYYVSSRYYDPEIGRWINADNVIAGVGGSIQGYNMFAYCFNNPVNMSDPSGNWPKWIETAANWVNKNIIQPVANFFSTSTNTISGQFQEGIFRGSGSLTGGYSELNWRLDDKIKSSGSQDGWVGGFGKASVGNANGKIGIGNNNLSASLKGVADGLVATAQAGLHYKDGFGVGAKAKASVLSGRATTEFNIFGWQVELGVSGELLSIGAEATIGIFPTESGGKEFRMKAGVAPGPYGWGYVVRIKSPY